MKKTSVLILILLHACFSYSQDLSGPDYENFSTYTQTDFSTPEVKAFEKVSLIPNDLSTGKIGLKIPIYTINTGRISYPISISYNSGGIKVDEQASEIGLGWNLSKSVITRQVVDQNDFDNVGKQWLDPSGGGFEEGLDDPEYYAHFMVNQDLAGDKSRMGYFLKKDLNIKASASNKSVDEMPDLYSLMTSDGFATKFYFRDIETPVELNEAQSIISGMKIKQVFENPQYDLFTDEIYFPMYDFGKIEVTSNKGIKYTFEDYDVFISNSIELPTDEFYEGRFTMPQISSWHISKIEDLLTGDKIEFEYTSYNADPVTEGFDPFGTVGDGGPPSALLMSRSIKTFPWKGWIEDNFNNCPPGNLRGGIVYNDNKIAYLRYNYTRHYVKRRLENITFNGGRINFDWGEDRLDQYNTKKLNSIKIFSKEDGTPSANKLINKFDFTFDYFDSGCSNPYKCKRLKLSSIKELGKPSHIFSYFGEDDIFPEITSNNKDFLGYYNVVSPDPEANIVPTLYFYPNQLENSILPFNISGVEKYAIYGDYDATSNLNNVKRWSLQTIRYPTGALTELNYELNEIKLFDQNVVASGLRLSRTIIRDEEEYVRYIEYKYLNEDNTSSGSFVNPPNYGRPTLWLGLTSEDSLFNWEENSLYDSFIINQYPRIDADLSNGNYITYSTVQEEEINNGYAISKFSSNDLYGNVYNRSEPTQEELNDFTGGDLCEVNFAINNSAYGIEYYTDNSFMRGKLLNKKYFDSDDRLIKETINNYAENNEFESEIFKKSFFRAKNKYINDSNDDYLNMIVLRKDYKPNTFKLVQSKTKDYFYGEQVSVEENFEYNSLGLIATSTKDINLNEKYISNYNYVIDSDDQETGIAYLLSINNLTDYVENERQISLNGNIENVNSFKKEFKPNGFVNKILTRKKGNEYIEEYDFEAYDDKGNPIQFRDKTGKITSLFWHNDQLLARVENETWDNIKNYILENQNYDIDNCESGNCDQYFSETLRQDFPNAQIYSYAYESAIEGPVSVTDPKNETVYYEYDDLGRLIHIKDLNNNIIKSHEYNYKIEN